MGQIVDVMKFEMLKNRKKFLILVIFVTLIAILSVFLPPLVSDQPQPAEISQFLAGNFGFFSFFVIIGACAYGGSLIADEFDKKTCYMLFPKVSKARLFIGKVLSQYILFALNLLVYYVFLAIAAVVNYEQPIPVTFLWSYLIAILYGGMLFSFVVLLSSFLRSTSLTVIVAFLLLFLGFSMVTGIVTLLAYEVEPLFDITYYYNMITAVIDFPDPRFQDIVVPVDEGIEFTVRSWFSPVINTGVIFCSIYLTIFLMVAYLRFQNRESK